jgi:hypothetical protein
MYKREYILFRDVEHSGISSAPGTSSIQFRELDHHSISQIYSSLTEFRQIPGIPKSDGILENSVQSSLDSIPGITSRPHPHAYCSDRRLVAGISK